MLSGQFLRILDTKVTPLVGSARAPWNGLPVVPLETNQAILAVTVAITVTLTFSKWKHASMSIIPNDPGSGKVIVIMARRESPRTLFGGHTGPDD